MAFLSFVALLDFGIGAVVQSSLYKPLAEKDTKQVSEIYRSASKFFTKIAIVFIAYLSILILVYPKLISDHSFWFIASLIFIIAFSTIAQYFFGIVNKLLLIADQKSYITQIVDLLVIILNVVFIAIFILKGFSIHFVLMISTLVNILRPLLLMLYVNSNYTINKKITYSEEPIKQKWNGIAQHLAYFVVNNTDVMVLTVFSKTSLISVSIYSIYYMITNGLKVLFESVVSGGFASYFGNMLANRETNVTMQFLRFEWLIHTIVTLIFSCCGLLIVKFVMIYTDGVNDANYFQPIFGYLITLAMASFCLRLPYNALVRAAGHYKETQTSAFIEMLINIGVSIILVLKYDIVGVAIGTLLAMTYRTLYFANYLKNIIKGYSFKFFIKHICIDLLSVILIVLISRFVPDFELSFIGWTLNAIIIFVIALTIIIIINIIFYTENMLYIYKKFRLRI
ncbi:polysaccharide biosynthesis C-terminal domain-containing protein [Mesobacillus sp. LC4]